MVAATYLTPWDKPHYLGRPQDNSRLARSPSGRLGVQWGLGHPRNAYATELKAKLRAQNEIRFAIIRRRAELQVGAMLENAPFSAASAADFDRFFDQDGFASRPKIFLLDNGNLRALWSNDKGEQVGIQFLGGSTIQFVIFASRPAPLLISREYGRDTILNLHGRLRAAHVEALVFA